MIDRITERANKLPPISLEEMSGIKLMNRTDTKYVATINQLLGFLQAVEGKYYIQEINGLRIASYHTTYFDTEDGTLSANEGETEYPHIPDWSDWERACVREEIRNGTYRFEDEVRLETLPKGNCFYAQGTAKLIQTPDGTYIEGNCYGEPFSLHKKPLELDSLHIEYDYLGRGDCVEVSVTDDSYWCYLSKRDAITKLSFATEEIYFLAKENAPQKTPRTRRVRKDDPAKEEAPREEPIKAEV